MVIAAQFTIYNLSNTTYAIMVAVLNGDSKAKVVTPREHFVYVCKR